VEPSIYCRGCGYNLAGVSVCRCPECGRAFDPADPYSYLDEKEKVRRARPWRVVKWQGATLCTMLAFSGLLLVFDATGWHRSLSETTTGVLHGVGVLLVCFSVLGQLVTLLESCILTLLYSDRIWPGRHLFFWSAAALPWVVTIGLVGLLFLI